MIILNEKSLVQRINRKLDGERLKLCRYDSHWIDNLGRGLDPVIQYRRYV